MSRRRQQTNASRRPVDSYDTRRGLSGEAGADFCSLQGLAAFLKAIGYLIPLMDAEYANYYTREVMLILIREFQSPDEEMKKIVLKVTSSLLLRCACLRSFSPGRLTPWSDQG